MNLLDLARTRAAGPPAETHVDLRAVCAEAIDSVRRAGEPDDVAVSLHGEASTVGDAAALTRAVTNLVDNAVRHAGHDVTVTVDGTERRVASSRSETTVPASRPTSSSVRASASFPAPTAQGSGWPSSRRSPARTVAASSSSNADDGTPGAVARLELGD